MFEEERDIAVVSKYISTEDLITEGKRLPLVENAGRQLSSKVSITLNETNRSPVPPDRMP